MVESDDSDSERTQVIAESNKVKNGSAKRPRNESSSSDVEADAPVKKPCTNEMIRDNNGGCKKVDDKITDKDQEKNGKVKSTDLQNTSNDADTTDYDGGKIKVNLQDDLDNEKEENSEIKEEKDADIVKDIAENRTANEKKEEKDVKDSKTDSKVNIDIVKIILILIYSYRTKIQPF